MRDKKGIERIEFKHVRSCKWNKSKVKYGKERHADMLVAMMTFSGRRPAGVTEIVEICLDPLVCSP